MIKKLVVIGSNSFSGCDFIDLVLKARRWQVAGISRSTEKDPLFLTYKRNKRKNFQFFQMDLNRDMEKVIDLFDKIKPDYVINFAGQVEVATSWKHPDQYFVTNTLAVVRLADHLKDVSYLDRFVHISTPEVYGSCNNIREDARINPSTPYAASKAAADLFLNTLYKNYQFPLVTIRSTNIYGVGQQLFRIIPKSIINIKLGKSIELHGGGRAVKSYIHIRDISRGELLAMEKGKNGEVYHLSPDKAMTVKELVKMICSRMGADFKKAARDVPERLGQDKAYIIDSSKARKILGWKPVISLEEGIDEVIEWVEDNWTEIKKLPLEYIHKT